MYSNTYTSLLSWRLLLAILTITRTTQPTRIDTHSHFVPSFYRDIFFNITGNASNTYFPTWTKEAHLAMMDDLNISKSILSISAPGVYLVPDNNALAIQLARNVNIYASELKRELPDKFGFWASLPLPDVNGSLAEVAYALDTLHADGIILLTNYLGTYLGAPAFEPLFAELNHRHVPVFIHPQVPATAPSAGPIPATPLLWPPAVFEFEFDIARALVNLFYTQTIARYPNITYIVAHAGGALPPLVERVGSALAVFGIQIPGVDAAALKVALRSRFYFDLAGWPFPEPIQGLLPYVSARQLTYGSDYPFTPLGVVEGLGTVFDECLPRVFGSEEAREAVEFGNAERLLGGAGEGLEEGLG